MAIAFVQQAINSAASGTTLAVTIVAAKVGSCLICSCSGDGQSVTGIAGGGVTWVKADSNGVNEFTEIWYGLNSSGSGTTVTVTFNAGATALAANVSEFSGVAEVGALDVHSNNSGTSTSPTTTSITPTRDGELVIANLTPQNGSVSAGPTNGFTALTTVTQGIGTVLSAYLIQGSAAAISTGWTMTSSGWGTAAASFKAIPILIVPVDDMEQALSGPIAGRHWPVPDSAKAQEDWIQKIFLPSFAPASDEWDGRNLPWPACQPDHYAEQGFNPTLFVPVFDPTRTSWGERFDISTPRTVAYWEDDSPLNIFLPPPGWDDGFDYSFQPTVKLEQYGEEGNSPIIPAAFDDDFLYSYQPQMRIDDERDYQMRIFIPVAVWDDDWQMAISPQMKLDDERDYQMRIFLPRQAWDDDFQSLILSTVKLEDADSPLQLFLPPFDPTVVRDGEQIQQIWPATVKWDDEREYQMRIFIPVVAWDDDWQAGIPLSAKLEEADSPLQLFLPPFDPTIVRDEEQGQWAALWPARLGVEPEGEWPNLIVVSVIEPPPSVPQPPASRFRLHQGVRITRGF